MAKHLAFRSGNPALTANTFTGLGTAAAGNTMTIMGTVHKTALALALLMLTATYSWSIPTGPDIARYNCISTIISAQNHISSKRTPVRLIELQSSYRKA